MADINQVVLVGRLVRDAELRYTSAGTAVSKFSLAINRRVKKGDQWMDEVSYFDITLWGKQAESLSKYLIKGKQIGVNGELRQNRWEQDGQKRSKIEINANNIQLLGGAPGGSDGENRGNSRPSNSSQSFEQFAGASSSDVDFEDDIPF
jgi:single-strand DNA-binding protein